MAPSFKLPIIIIGGGLVGLTLAQALVKAGIPCRVYERDAAPETERGGGWAITIHWALAALKECLPESIFRKLDSIQVDPEQGVKDTGRFLFLDMATALPKYEIPPSARKRVNRRMLRSLLSEGIGIEYDKRFVGFEVNGDDLVVARFEDGTSVNGNLLVACDGGNSLTRRLLFKDSPTDSELYHLPARTMGVTVRMTEEQVQPLRQIDPLLFQGCHPDTGVFLWYSTVSTPAINGSASNGDPYYEGQLIMSWLHHSPADDVPETDAMRLNKMRDMVQPFESRLKTAVESIPKGAEIKEIKLQDWPTQPWPSQNGLITLAGDAAHAMTMYRGEAFNHGVTDAAALARELAKIRDGEVNQQEGIADYAEEVVKRTHDAVLLSRQACLDAHDYHKLQNDSPLVSKRARVLQPGKFASGSTGNGLSNTA